MPIQNYPEQKNDCPNKVTDDILHNMTELLCEQNTLIGNIFCKINLIYNDNDEVKPEIKSIEDARVNPEEINSSFLSSVSRGINNISLNNSLLLEILNRLNSII